MTDFLAEDYKFTGDLLRRYAFGPAQDTALFRAVCVHNLGVILAALEHAEAITTHAEEYDDGIPVISKHGDRETI